MTIECFPYFNELDVLEIHFETTASVVDQYVIVEGDRTFRGKAKDYNLHRARERFGRFWHKVLYQPLRSLNDSDPWKNEAAERNELFNIVRKMGWDRSENTVILVDADEIPAPAAILEFQASSHRWMNLKMPIYNYRYNLQVNDRWTRPKILRGGGLGTAHEVRLAEAEQSLEHGGWHFSNVMTPELFRLKHQSFSHIEADREELLNVERIKQAMERKEDLFQLGTVHFDPRVVPLASLPPFIQTNRHRFEAFLVPEEGGLRSPG